MFKADLALSSGLPASVCRTHDLLTCYGMKARPDGRSPEAADATFAGR